MIASTRRDVDAHTRNHVRPSSRQAPSDGRQPFTVTP